MLDCSKRDDWEWVLNRRGTFTSKSMYYELLNPRMVYFHIKAFGSQTFPLKNPFSYGMRI